ncbi:hypothetical protein JNUCC0626_50045 (plasmid) [Lentzea sp. JNUCC 0626]|uniref:hypothetical protein n=1 Tax=Lentzea sp. JNUCC 0626 TaxID=3367513 RepID=UPI0037478A4A
MIKDLCSPEDVDVAIASEERHARAQLRNLIEDVPADKVDAVIAMLRDFAGELPERRAVALRGVSDPDARMLIAEEYPELAYEVEGSRGANGKGTVTHTWTCTGTGAFVIYRQGPEGCTVVENGGLLGRHLWDDLVGTFTAYDMTRPPKTAEVEQAARPERTVALAAH